MIKKCIKFLPTFLWMGLIFMLSNEQASDSSALADNDGQGGYLEGDDTGNDTSDTDTGNSGDLTTGSFCDSSAVTCVNPGTEFGVPQCGPSTDNSGNSQSTNLPAKQLSNPINIVTGNKFQHEVDIAPLPGLLGLSWQRYYNSQNSSRSALGAGWRHGYDVSVKPDGDNRLWLTQVDGRQILFRLTGPDQFEPTLTTDGTLRTGKISGNSRAAFRWQWPDGRLYDFNKKGLLTDIQLPSGQSVGLQYTTNDQLMLVRDAQRRELSASYYPNGRLKQVTDTAGKTTRYRYDRFSNLERVSYANGSERRYHYEDGNDRNNLTGITNELGVRYATWSYDKDDRAISGGYSDDVNAVNVSYLEDGKRLVTNSLGEVSTYGTRFQSGVGVVTEIAGPGCSTCGQADTRYEYSPDAKLVATVNKQGLETRNDYDDLGRLIATTRVYPNGTENVVVRYEYNDDVFRPARVLRPSVNPVADHIFEIDYNTTGQIARILEQGWSPTATGNFQKITKEMNIGYRDGLMTHIDGPRDDVVDVTAFRYDQLGRVISISTPDGRKTRVLRFDDYGRPTQLQTGKAQPTTLAYDLRGNVTAVSRRGRTVKYDYNSASQLKRIVGPDSDTIQYHYDDAGRAVGVTGANGQRISTDLNSEGQVTGAEFLSEYSDVLSQISFYYDAEGRLAQLDRNGEIGIEREFDAAGNLANVTDTSGNATGFLHNGVGQLLSVTRPGNAVTRLGYDRKNNLSSVVDARDNATEYQYDDFGNLVSYSHPDSGAVRLEYDVAGNQIVRSDASGNTQRYDYDAANRLLKAASEDGVSLYAYDKETGRLATVDSAGAGENFTYDADGRLEKHERIYDGITLATEYQYTAAGKLTRKKLPDGQVLQFHYHEEGKAKGKLRAITRRNLLTQTTIIGELNNSGSSTVEQLTHGNGLVVTRQEDGLGNTLAIQHGSTLSLNYQFDAFGRISGIEKNSVVQQLVYDTAGRVITANSSLGSYTYQYDSVGNRKQSTSSDSKKSTEYTYNTNGQGNRLLAANDDEYRYDEAGNTLSSANFAYAYNQRGRPLKVYDKATNTLVAEYAYNAFGERIKKVKYTASKNGRLTKKVTYYLYDGRQLSAEVNETGKVLTQYLYHKNRLIAKLQGRDIYAVHTDHQGTPKAVTDAKQSIVWQADFTPYGEARLALEKITLNVRLPGQYFDAETATHYNYFRDYDPKTGRYLTPDPSGLNGGINAYAYAAGNPAGFVDVLGLKPLAEGQNDGSFWIEAEQYAQLGTYYNNGQVAQYFNYLNQLTNDPIYKDIADVATQSFLPDDAKWFLHNSLMVGSFNSLSQVLCNIADRSGIFAIPEQNRLLNAAYQHVGLSRGAGGFIKDTAVGLFQLTTGTIGLSIDLTLFGRATDLVNQLFPNADLPAWLPSYQAGKETVGRIADIATAIAIDPALIWSAITDPILKDWAEGRYGEAIGRGSAEIATLPFAILKATNISRIANIFKVAKRADAVTPDEYAAIAKKVLEDARANGVDLGNVVDAARESGTLDDLLKAGVLTAAELQALKNANKLSLDEVARAVAKRFPQSYFDAFASKATRNPDSDKLILGRGFEDGKSYTKVAAHYKATYFKLDNWQHLSRSHTPDEIWRINETFIDQHLKAGKRIILSHDPSKASRFYLREIQYLEDLGYKFVQDGWVWRAIK